MPSGNVDKKLMPSEAAFPRGLTGEVAAHCSGEGEGVTGLPCDLEMCSVPGTHFEMGP